MRQDRLQRNARSVGIKGEKITHDFGPGLFQYDHANEKVWTTIPGRMFRSEDVGGGWIINGWRAVLRAVGTKCLQNCQLELISRAHLWAKDISLLQERTEITQTWEL